MIDRVVQSVGRQLCETPVEFKWFTPGFRRLVLLWRRRNAGASFLRLDGTVWTTDKDGPIMNLLAARSRSNG